MSEGIVIGLLTSLNLTAALATISAASKLARGGLLGAICGLVIELLRLLLAAGIASLAGDAAHSASVAWLVNLRIFNIPILIGLGFMAGSATASNQSGAAVSAETAETKPDKPEGPR